MKDLVISKIPVFSSVDANSLLKMYICLQNIALTKHNKCTNMRKKLTFY